MLSLPNEVNLNVDLLINMITNTNTNANTNTNTNNNSNYFIKPLTVTYKCYNYAITK